MRHGVGIIGVMKYLLSLFMWGCWAKKISRKNLVFRFKKPFFLIRKGNKVSDINRRCCIRIEELIYEKSKTDQIPLKIIQFDENFLK